MNSNNSGCPATFWRFSGDCYGGAIGGRDRLRLDKPDPMVVTTRPTARWVAPIGPTAGLGGSAGKRGTVGEVMRVVIDVTAVAERPGRRRIERKVVAASRGKSGVVAASRRSGLVGAARRHRRGRECVGLRTAGAGWCRQRRCIVGRLGFANGRKRRGFKKGSMAYL